MEKLPVEILKEIFFQLHQMHQVECMTVCQKWHSAISEFCLFRSIHITSVNQLEKLKKRLEQEPAQGEKVERIFINAFTTRNSDYGLFLKLFVKPKVVVLPTANILQFELDWYDTLECFCELNSTSLLYRLFDSGVYSRLESIAVYRDGFDISAETFIKKLANAPALKKLRMEHFSIAINDLELLHTTLPALCVLDFDSTTLFNYHDVPNYDIVPATSVTSFNLDLECIEFLDSAVNLFRYIRKKYTNLVETKLYLSLDDMGDDDDANKLYREGMVLLLQSFGPQLKRLSTFSVDSPPILLDMLDKVDYHLESLDVQLLVNAGQINESLGPTKQLKCIQTFKLLGLSSTTFNWLSDFIMLRELDLTFSYFPKGTHRTVTLNRILEACPETVDSITIANMKLIYEPSNIQLPFVKKLHLRESTLADNIGDFISRALPHLRYLELDYCRLAYKHLSFPDLHLDYLDIKDIHKRDKDNLLVITSQNDKQQYYAKSIQRLYDYEVRNKHLKIDSVVYPFAKRISNNSSKSRPLISFVCASVNYVIY